MKTKLRKLEQKLRDLTTAFMMLLIAFVIVVIVGAKGYSELKENSASPDAIKKINKSIKIISGVNSVQNRTDIKINKAIEIQLKQNEFTQNQLTNIFDVIDQFNKNFTAMETRLGRVEKISAFNYNKIKDKP